MNTFKFSILLALVAGISVAFAPSSSAQKLGKDYFELPEFGFRFKPLDDFKRIPPQASDKEFGIIGKMDGKELTVPIKGQGVTQMNADIRVFRFVDKKITTTGDAEIDIKIDKIELDKYLDMAYRGVNAKAVLLDEQVKINKELEARHRQWRGSLFGDDGGFILDAWSYPVHDAEVHVVYSVPEKHQKKWLKVFEKSAKTFEVTDIVEPAKLHKGMTYEELLAYHDQDQRDQGGWRAIPTPSKRYIIKTDSDDDDFIQLVIDRLEKSRDLFEKDFPPKKAIDHVSIVRVCAKEETFHAYGGTGGGVAGWFSPASTELVLYDGKNVDRNMTFAVMTHEGFHQYCHFLFDESEAHRWFDEGHGDYYGGAKMGRSKNSPMEITSKMPAGLDRLSVIREMVREHTYAPVADHINYNHQQWQTQGPSNVSCYAQSWSIIFMLRQGMEGNVPSKVWKPEYAQIIPKYIETLNDEYATAYAEARAKEIKEKQERERRKAGPEAKPEQPGQAGDPPKEGDPGQEGEPGKPGTDAPGDTEISIVLDDKKPYLGEAKKKEIWTKAMDASWGKVDLDQFERDWVEYVNSYLK